MTEFQFNVNLLGNSDEIMDEFISKKLKFDLILTDPPYNLNKDFGNDSDSLNFSDFLKINQARIEKVNKLLSDNGSVIWFGIHRYIGHLQLIMYDAGLYYRSMNIWHYKNGFSRATRTPLTQYEPFLWFSKSNKNWVYNADDVRVPYKSSDRLRNPVYYKDKDGNKKIWIANPKGALRGDIWEFPTLAGRNFKDEKTEHPTQKPEALITEIIKAYCPKNSLGFFDGTILDPFHGSGTVGVCCEKLNKQGHKIRWIGIELEKKWVEVANRRIKSI